MTITRLPAAGGPDDSGAAGVPVRVEANLVARRRELVTELELCLEWADLHGEPPAFAAPGGDRLVALGGDGTPMVQDLCLEELSIARRVHVLNTRAMLADALDLRHRLPQLWAATRALACEPWLARKVARMTRGLDRDRVGLVDDAVSAALGQAPSRVLAIAEAKVIEADTRAHEAELVIQAAGHGVWLGRLRPADPEDPESGRGVRTLYARLAPEDAHWLDHSIDALADLLADEDALRAQYAPGLALVPDDAAPSRDQLRAAALGILGRPDQAATLLGLIGPTDAPVNPRAATVYVHLHESVLRTAGSGTGDGVARVEGIGPILASHLRRLVGHASVTVKPVVDLATGASVNGYEHPTAMRERILLRNTGDVFPHATSLSRRLDLDHVDPYDADGPPGQTGDHNTAPLGRRSHRVKTHAGYALEQLGPTTYLWATPHGLQRLVDDTGTHAIDHTEVRLLRLLHPPDAA